MSAELNPETKRLLDKASWEWQPLEPVLAEMSELIAPGKALRKYQAKRAISDQKRTGQLPERILSESEQIKSGARSFVRGSLNAQRKTGRIEVKEEDGVEYFRLGERRTSTKPCSACGHVEQPNFPRPSVLSSTLTRLESQKLAEEVGMEAKLASNVIQFPRKIRVI